jgi:hypothetical protein
LRIAQWLDHGPRILKAPAGNTKPNLCFGILCHPKKGQGRGRTLAGKQKKGNKRMKSAGNVNIPQGAFIEVLKA